MRPTTDLYDDNVEIARTCSTQFRDFGALRSFSGPVRTLRCRNDNQLLRTLLGEQGDSAVLVVDGDGSTEVALLGDMLAARGARNGWSGIVIHGAVRDSLDLAKIEIGIKALGVNPAKSAKTGAGEVDIPITFGGATFEPGNWIYCDQDGVLVSQSPID